MMEAFDGIVTCLRFNPGKKQHHRLFANAKTDVLVCYDLPDSAIDSG